MNQNNQKMTEALLEHMGQQIEQLLESAPTPKSQILLEELKSSCQRLRKLLLADIEDRTSPEGPTLTGPASETTHVTASVSIKSKKILYLIDDDKDALKVLSYMLERKSSFQISCFTDPLQAWDTLKTSQPDMVLMDLMMPGISGLELLRKIRQVPDLAKVKIMIGSSKSFDKDRIEVLKSRS